MRHRAFMTFDALAGIFLLAALATALAVAGNMRAKTAMQLANQRKANAAAQEALSNLQAGSEAKLSDVTAKVTLRYSGKRVGNLEWVEVTVVREGRYASIMGLAPTTQPGGTP